MEFPRPGIESEPQLRLRPQWWQCQILNPVWGAGDQICAATDTRSDPWPAVPQWELPIAFFFFFF